MFLNNNQKELNHLNRKVIENVINKYKIDQSLDKNIVKALEVFLNTNETRIRFGNYFIDGNKLMYKTMVQENKRHMPKVDLQALLTAMDTGKAVACDLSRSELVELIEKHGTSSYGQNVAVKVLKENTIAIKLKRNGENLILGNSNVLDLIGRRVSFGHEMNNRNETDIQLELSKHVPMLPFSVFKQANLDINTLKVIEQTGAETITRKYETGKRIKDKETKKEHMEVKEETVHFTGASVFEVSGQCFLFDMDRREIEHKIFNPFLVKLPVQVNSVAMAYTALKPNQVIDAEKAGLKVKRQGEWFFIPVDSTTSDRMEKLSEIKGNLKQITLRAGNNRPNDAKGIEFGEDNKTIKETDRSWDRPRNETVQCYVTGKVSHRGREHADLILKGWHVAVPNTAQDSFTISGDID